MPISLTQPTYVPWRNRSRMVRVLSRRVRTLCRCSHDNFSSPNQYPKLPTPSGRNFYADREGVRRKRSLFGRDERLGLSGFSAGHSPSLALGKSTHEYYGRTVKIPPGQCLPGSYVLNTKKHKLHTEWSYISKTTRENAANQRGHKLHTTKQQATHNETQGTHK